MWFFHLPFWESIVILLVMVGIGLIAMAYGKHCAAVSMRAYKPFDPLNQIVIIISILIYSNVWWGIIIGIICAIFLLGRNAYNIKRTFPSILLTVLQVAASPGILIIIICRLIGRAIKNTK